VAIGVLGVGIDSHQSFATGTPLAALEEIDPARIFLVQLSDFMWREVRTEQVRIDTARHFRVSPGEGAHCDERAHLVRLLDRMGDRGDYSFEVFNDDRQQMPLEGMAARARRAAGWLAVDVLRRAVPLLGARCRPTTRA
jgi:2-keto-myo-inositol isomerase